MLSPAQSCNSLTVGALHSDFAGPGAFTGAAIDPFGTLRMTNLGSRLGTGIGGSIKPDLVMPGGRQAARARVTPSGLEVFSQEIEGVGQRAAIPDTRGGRRDRTQRSSGTSNAAALATRDAIRIAEALDDIPPVTGEVRGVTDRPGP
ncbi:S8 family serine peptidase [Chenggangzhangella methanolivorans]|uniref:S8 family serine peptidase n=1 Tax=Chenggangzhangella methanolivorans TaxID=1437009 RepID=A0A9E6RIC3_9HYPH|nr:S8 family serine peptidase [Chenggangzhangella methanolivorans]QZO02001.1 S8 family serine peptidase [Chenggangzhangella methanolivorans]